MRNRVRAVLVSRDELRAERVMLFGLGFFNFSSKHGRESPKTLAHVSELSN
jgi:hypothetical protein